MLKSHLRINDFDAQRMDVTSLFTRTIKHELPKHVDKSLVVFLTISHLFLNLIIIIQNNAQKKDASKINLDASCLVAGTRLELMTFGL